MGEACVTPEEMGKHDEGGGLFCQAFFMFVFRKRKFQPLGFLKEGMKGKQVLPNEDLAALAVSGLEWGAFAQRKGGDACLHETEGKG